MENVYIMGGCRTAIGKYGGSLKSIPAHTLATTVVKSVLERTHVTGDMVDEVILGEVRQSSEASNIARYVALEAGMPESVPGYTVNRLCASSMQATLNGCEEIWLGMADTVVAGGTDNMSRAPMYIRQGRWGDGPMKLVDSNIEGGLADQPASLYGLMSMSQTAENVAERFGITREMQDAFACDSQQRATEVDFAEDEFIKPKTTMENLAKLKPIVKPGGTVTAGNACGLNDGASALVLMSESKVKETGLKPLAKIKGIARAALDPEIMGYGPVISTTKLLKELDMTVDQIDLVELNEAFASQAVACVRDLKLDPAKVNINGGAIALGHPLGCTGARLIVTLLNNLIRTGGKTGLATLCIGGGQSMATMIERV